MTYVTIRLRLLEIVFIVRHKYSHCSIAVNAQFQGMNFQQVVKSIDYNSPIGIMPKLEYGKFHYSL